VLVIAGVFELGARLLNLAPELSPPDEGTPLQAHPERMWALATGSFELDGGGYTVGEDGLRLTEDEGKDLRVLTLGDSSIFGHGLSDADTLHEQLEESLAESGVQVDVSCGGVPGYSTLQVGLLLRDVGWDLEPRLLVLGSLWSDNQHEFFVDQEWLDALARPAWRMEFFLDRSHFWRWVRRFSLSSGQTDIPVGWIRAPYSKRDRRVPLNAYAQAVDALLVEAASRGVGVVILAPANRERLETDHVLHPWDDYFHALEQVAAHRSVLVVDAAELIRRAGLTLDEAFLDRLHPSSATNAVYAAGLTEALVGSGWPSNSLLPDRSPPSFEADFVDRWIEGLE